MRIRREHRTIAVAVITVACCMCTQVARADSLRVDSTSTAMIPDGSTWTLSFPFLQDALTAAGPGDVIIVAQGSYFPDDGAGLTQGLRTHTFEMKDQVILLGGFAGLQGQNPDDRDVAAFPTVLSGDIDGLIDDSNQGFQQAARLLNSFSVVNGGPITNDQAQLDGFTIRGGQGGVGGGGAGMFMPTGSSPRIRNCTFTRNWTGGSGGGLLLDNTSFSRIEDCVFFDNEASEGGGMTIRNFSNPDIRRCRFENNTAFNRGGGGVLMKLQGRGTFTDCVFVNNNLPTLLATFAGGAGLLLCDSSIATLRGCLFDGNVNVDGRGGAIFTDLSSLLTVVDCAFTSNKPGEWII